MTIDDLKTYGANTEEGLKRCMNNEGFYLRLVKMIPGDANFPMKPRMRSRAAPAIFL